MSTQQRNLWTREEDEILQELVEELGQKRWTDICKELVKRMPGSTRTLMQCRERYFNHLCPGLNKGSWTSEEILLILQLHRQHANQWSRFCPFLPGRSQNAIKCFFYSALKKALTKHNKQQGHNRRCMRTIKSLVRDKTTTDFLNMEEDYRDNSQPYQPCTLYPICHDTDYFNAYQLYLWVYWCCYYQVYYQSLLN